MHIHKSTKEEALKAALAVLMDAGLDDGTSRALYLMYRAIRDVAATACDNMAEAGISSED